MLNLVILAAYKLATGECIVTSEEIAALAVTTPDMIMFVANRIGTKFFVILTGDSEKTRSLKIIYESDSRHFTSEAHYAAIRTHALLNGFRID